jgi:hypothetical protein
VSKPGEPFEASDFDDVCEDCGAPPGSLCYTSCESGYSAETRWRHAELIERDRRTGHDQK